MDQNSESIFRETYFADLFYGNTLDTILTLFWDSVLKDFQKENIFQSNC